MSRGGSCKQVLNEPSAAVTSIKPSGDCFYECIALAMSTGGIDVRDLVKCAEEDDDGAGVGSALNDHTYTCDGSDARTKPGRWLELDISRSGNLLKKNPRLFSQP